MAVSSGPGWFRDLGLLPQLGVLVQLTAADTESRCGIHGLLVRTAGRFSGPAGCVHCREACRHASASKHQLPSEGNGSGLIRETAHPSPLVMHTGCCCRLAGKQAVRGTFISKAVSSSKLEETKRRYESWKHERGRYTRRCYRYPQTWRRPSDSVEPLMA